MADGRQVRSGLVRSARALLVERAPPAVGGYGRRGSPDPFDAVWTQMGYRAEFLIVKRLPARLWLARIVRHEPRLPPVARDDLSHYFGT